MKIGNLIMTMFELFLSRKGLLLGSSLLLMLGLSGVVCAQEMIADADGNIFLPLQEEEKKDPRDLTDEELVEKLQKGLEELGVDAPVEVRDGLKEGLIPTLEEIQKAESDRAAEHKRLHYLEVKDVYIPGPVDGPHTEDAEWNHRLRALELLIWESGEDITARINRNFAGADPSMNLEFLQELLESSSETLDKQISEMTSQGKPEEMIDVLRISRTRFLRELATVKWRIDKGDSISENPPPEEPEEEEDSIFFLLFAVLVIGAFLGFGAALALGYTD